MAELHFIENQDIELYLDMAGGYVLDFSDRTFFQLVESTCQRDIDAFQYQERGKSKANRLRTFLRIEPASIAADVLFALVAYADRPEVPGQRSPELRERIVRIASRLRAPTREAARAVEPRRDLRVPTPSQARAGQHDDGHIDMLEQLARDAGLLPGSEPAPHRQPCPPAPSGVPESYFEALWHRGFDLEEHLGQGRSGRVFRANQRNLKRPVAVKFCEIPQGSEGLRVRFEREAALLASVESSQIPYVLTPGTVREGDGRGTPYYVMQYISGRPLNKVLESGLPTLTTALPWFRDVLSALAAAHDKRVAHRDVAPPNVMLGSDGRCWLIDFSIGVDLDAPRTTRTGDQLGRAGYLAPELMDGSKMCSETSDVYAAGVLLHEMLTGEQLVTPENVTVLLSEVPDQIRDLVLFACARNPSDRFLTARVFLEELDTIMSA